MPRSPHPAWLPDAALAPLRTGTVAVLGKGAALDTARTELEQAPSAPPASADLVVAAAGDPALFGIAELPEVPAGGYAILRTGDQTIVLGDGDISALRGFYALVRDRALDRLSAASPADGVKRSAPAAPLRMLDHWDNIDVHPWMGQVERGYAGGSIFYDDGTVREDLSRVRAYARLLAVTGIDAVAINNVNVHAREARLLTDGLGDVARIAAEFRAYGIRIFLSVSFGSPMRLGRLPTNDPLESAVAEWWANAATAVYAAVPDLGGFLVKADSEGQPGPFAYGRTHADGANLLADALRPHGGVVMWR